MRFRCNIERIGEIMAYEISKTLHYEIENVTTPLGTAQVNTISNNIVLATVLRAGMPMHTGMLNYLDQAENAFVSAYRKYSDETHFEIHTEYIASPDLTGKTLIICDPMLATGRSIETAFKALLAKGTPSKIIVAGIISSKQGAEYIEKHLPDADIWTAAMDNELNDHSYIVPGLGDAGDLAFGDKLD